MYRDSDWSLVCEKGPRQSNLLLPVNGDVCWPRRKRLFIFVTKLCALRRFKEALIEYVRMHFTAHKWGEFQLHERDINMEEKSLIIPPPDPPPPPPTPEEYKSAIKNKKQYTSGMYKSSVFPRDIYQQ